MRNTAWKPFQMSRLEAACAAKPPGTSIKNFLLGAKRKSPDIGTSPVGTLDVPISPAATASHLSRDKNAEVTLIEGAEKSPDISVKSFLHRAEKKTSGDITSPTNTLDRDGHSPEPSMSKRENAAVTAAKSSSKHQSVHQGHETGQSSDAGPSQPVSNAASTTNGNASETKSIDMEVLLALPEDMREQVITEYQQQGYIIPCLTNGRDSKNKCSAPEAQPGTSGSLRPQESRRQETSTIIQPDTAANGPHTSLSDTGRRSNSQLRGHEVHREVPTNKQNAPVPVYGEGRNFGEVGDASNSNSNFSTVSESAQDSPLITSFSQVSMQIIPQQQQLSICFNNF